MRLSPLLAVLPLLAERTRYTEKETLEFPRSCEGGTLDLESYGAYEVSEPIIFRSSCTLRGGQGSRIELAAPLKVKGDLTLEGHLQVVAGAAFTIPCVSVDGSLTVATEALSLARCIGGGAIHVRHGDLHIRGNMEVLDSRSTGRGGAVHVEGSVVQHRGSMIFNNCSTNASGGAVYVEGSYEQLSGSAVFLNCSAGDPDAAAGMSLAESKPFGGGGMLVGTMLRQQNGTMRFESCSSAFNGGGLLLREEPKTKRGRKPNVLKLLQSGGAMSFRGCTAGKRGGCAAVSGRARLQGSSQLDGCSSGAGAGGGLHVSESLDLAGDLMASGCHSGDDGGGLHVALGLSQTAGSLRFQSCSCRKKGGAIKVARGGMRLMGGHRSFENCSAGVSGGGIYVHYEGLRLVGDVSFQDCSARREGGGAFVQYGGFNESSQMAERGNVSFVNCTAGSRSAALYVGGIANISSLFLADCRDSSSTPFTVAGDLVLLSVMVSFEDEADQHACISADNMQVEAADCISASQCEFTSIMPNVSRLHCKRGRGRATELSEGSLVGTVGCYICDAGGIQPFQSSAANPECIRCPGGTRSCTSEHLQMQRGYMISMTNLSQRYHCPNEAACPGGDLPEATVPMCAPGYTGLGCAECLDSHGSSDSTILSCTPCAVSMSKWGAQVFYSISKDVVIFALAISSVLEASMEGKHSTVLLNQLMSFATVAGTALSGVMQTSSFAKLNENIQNVLVGSEIVVDFAQGQGSGTSTACLAEFVGLPKTIWMAHLLRSAVPALLIALLGIVKDPWLALVVGANCFLPEFCAGFGKYLVCYRVEKEKRGGELLCTFLPDIPAPRAMITGMITLCFLVAICGWTLAASSKTSPKPPHVLYLTNAYKEEFAAWEVERLVRKMLLTLVGAMLPITLSPALQLACLSVILVLSLVAYLRLLPYKENVFNLIEAALLSNALIITALSNSLLADDSSWAKSEATNQFLLFVTASLAMAGAGGTLLLLIRAYLREHRAKSGQG